MQQLFCLGLTVRFRFTVYHIQHVGIKNDKMLVLQRHKLSAKILMSLCNNTLCILLALSCSALGNRPTSHFLLGLVCIDLESCQSLGLNEASRAGVSNSEELGAAAGTVVSLDTKVFN